jgi:hypothetical protein
MAHPTPFIRYSDPGFQADRTRSQELRLQLSDQELILAVYDPLADHFPLIERFPVANSYNKVKPHEAMARILQTHSLTRLDFKRIEVIPVTSTWTLVPGALYEESSAADLLRLGAEVAEDQIVYADAIAGNDIRLVYTWPSLWKQVVDSQLPEASVRHFAGILADSLLRMHIKESVLTAHVQGFQMDLLGLVDGKIHLFNSFSFQSPEDFLYYIVLAYDRLEFNRELVPLQLTGEVESGSAIHQLCYKYIREVKFVSRPAASSIPDAEGEMGNLAPHALMNLLHPYDADH